MATHGELVVYLGAELGAYGYDEKPWFLPHLRLQGFERVFRERGLDQRVELRTSSLCATEDLLRFHTAEHVERVRRLCAANVGALDHGATLARQSVETAASHVVGAVAEAAREVWDGTMASAFVPISGFHHGRREKVGTYCLYNDAGVAIELLLAAGATKVGYVDIDVHFGDGVYDGFASDPRVAAVDLHEDARTLWPHSPDEPATATHMPGDRRDTGIGLAKGSKLNVPLPFGTEDVAFDAELVEALTWLESQRPEVVVFVAGVDAMKGDPMAHLSLSRSAIYRATQRVKSLARRICEGRLIVLGGGGYNPDTLPDGWCAVVEGLLD